jgi:hypothetical protein
MTVLWKRRKNRNGRCKGAVVASSGRMEATIL